MNRTHQIQIESLAPGLKTRLLERRRGDAAGVVDQELHRFTQCGVHGVRIGDVEDLCPRAGDRLGGGREAFGIASRQRDLPARVRQSACRGQSYAAAPAGNESVLHEVSPFAGK